MMTGGQQSEAEELVRKIEPLLAGKPRLLQSAVLADLLATWLAGHFDPSGSRKETEKIREQVLDHHLELVHLLLPFNERDARRGGECNKEFGKLPVN